MPISSETPQIAIMDGHTERLKTDGQGLQMLALQSLKENGWHGYD